MYDLKEKLAKLHNCSSGNSGGIAPSWHDAVMRQDCVILKEELIL